MDVRAARARELHRAAADNDGRGRTLREQRDALIRALRLEDPLVWSYDKLAAAVGCSRELIAHVVKGRA